jgi:hypothetical protein
VRILTLAACLLGLGLSAPAQAIDETGNLLVHGYGVNSCSKFLDVLQRRQEVQQNYYLVWLQGYITGLNEQLDETYDILAGTDIEGAMLWIRNWCAANPNQSIYKAADALTLERNPLRQRKAPKS